MPFMEAYLARFPWSEEAKALYSAGKVQRRYRVLQSIMVHGEYDPEKKVSETMRVSELWTRMDFVFRKYAVARAPDSDSSNTSDELQYYMDMWEEGVAAEFWLHSTDAAQFLLGPAAQ